MKPAMAEHLHRGTAHFECVSIMCAHFTPVDGKFQMKNTGSPPPAACTKMTMNSNENLMLQIDAH